MSKFTHFIGIDVSKEYFDAIFLQNQQTKGIHNQFENSKKGINELIKWIKSFQGNAENTLICLEYTGMYDILIISNLCYLIIKSTVKWF